MHFHAKFYCKTAVRFTTKVMAAHHIQPYAFEPRREVSEGDNDSESSDESQEMDSDHEDIRAGNVSWCTCKECRVMPTERESVCCQEMGELNQKLDGTNFNNIF